MEIICQETQNEITANLNPKSGQYFAIKSDPPLTIICPNPKDGFVPLLNPNPFKVRHPLICSQNSQRLEQPG